MRNIKLKYIIVVATLLLGFCKGFNAQQISLYDHYFYNPILNNPAYTGYKETTNIMLVSRTQWTGFKGAPKLNALSIDGNVFNENMGLGAIIFNDSKGVNKTVGGNLLYSYSVKFNEESHLNFGITARFISHQINFSEVTVENISDPTLLSTQQSKTNFNGDIGLAYFWKNLELGIAANQILSNKNSFFNEAGNTISFTPTYHLINSIKYNIPVNKEKQINIVPQALVRYIQNTPIQYEVNTNLYYKNMFWIGASYKNEYAVSANAGIQVLNKFDIGYAYSFITTDISQYAGMSHEIMLSLKFGNKEEKIKPIEKEEKTEEKETPKKETKALEKAEVKDTSIIILEAKVKDFTTTTENTPNKGVYIVVGSFVEEEYATKYAAKIKNKGYESTGSFYSKKRGYNYVYMFKENTLADAMKKIGEAREKGTKSAWIIILSE